MPEPRYIQRDEAGNLIGHFANPQPYAQELADEDHPDILAWKDRHRKANEEYLRLKALMNPEKLLARIEALERKAGR